MSTRRGLLRALGATAVAGPVAGCAGGEDGGDEDGSRSPGSGGDVGESATFAGDGGALTITPVETRLTDYLVGVDVSGSAPRELVSRDPPDDTAGSDGEARFLLVKLRMAHEGDEPVGYPQYGFRFESADGTEHDRVELERDDSTSYNLPIPRLPPAELSPGTETEVWVVFPVTASTTAGTLTADLEIQGFLDAEPQTWTLDLDSVDPETHEFDDLAVGESATVGNASAGLAFTVRGTRTESGSFEYPYSGDTYTADPPPDGEKYVFVDVAVENVGETGIASTPVDDMGVSGDGWETGSLSYQGDDAYNRGERETIDPGATKAGDVVFGTPTDAERFTFSIDVTTEITASWRLG